MSGITRRCISKGCRNTAVQKRRHCHKCRTRIYRDRYPLHYSFNNARKRARQRGHQWLLTLDEYRQLWASRWDGTGAKPEHYQVDRIDTLGPYSLGNCQVLHKARHIEKTYYDYKIIWAVKHARVTTVLAPF